MIESDYYISEKELEQLIYQVEQEELVTAPPDLTERILEAAGLGEKPEKQPEQMSEKVKTVSRKKDFRNYCFRVITSVAAAVALVFLLPELTDRMNLSGMTETEQVDKSEVVGQIQVQADVVKFVPDKATVVGVKPLPSKEEMLDDTGFIKKVISSTAEWFDKE